MKTLNHSLYIHRIEVTLSMETMGINGMERVREYGGERDIKEKNSPYIHVQRIFQNLCGLERWLCGSELWLLLQKTWVWLLATTCWLRICVSTKGYSLRLHCKDWRDSSRVKCIGCSCGRPEVHQPSVTPVQREAKSSAGLYIHCTHMDHSHTLRQNTPHPPSQ